jgi:pyrroloquinoline-quinone synthase
MQLLDNCSTAIERKVGLHQLYVEDIVRCTTLSEAVLMVNNAYDFHRHPYFIWMQAPSTSRSQFLCTQLPICFAIESFSQSLAAVLARTPVLERRLSVMENVAEEHGHGNLLNSHKYTFRQFLRALGATPEDLEIPCPASVLAFNHSLLGYCLTQSSEAGAAALGMLEHLYSSVSGMIARTINERAWAAPGSQSHYTVHEELDVEHARELLTLAESSWEEPRNRAHVAQGLVLGAHYLWALYE